MGLRSCIRQYGFLLLKLLPLAAGIISFSLVLVARFAFGPANLDEFILIESNFTLMLASGAGWFVTLMGLIAFIVDRKRGQSCQLWTSSFDWMSHAALGAGYYAGAVWTLVEEDEILSVFKQDVYSDYIKGAAGVGIVACVGHWLHAGASFMAWWRAPGAKVKDVQKTETNNNA